MKKIVNKLIQSMLLTLLILSASFSAFSQTKKRKSPVKKKTTSSAALRTEPLTSVPAKLLLKKNERPEAQPGTESQDDSNRRGIPNSISAPNPTYFYEFSRNGFSVSKISIEHDETGKGNISFVKNGSDELISDPIQLSNAALERINNSLSALDFLNSDTGYQHEKDYSHMGTIKFRLSKDGRERATTFNWTQNKDAKAMVDEYRKIGNQFIWIFDITLARENQPLESPRLMDSLDSMIRRNEISDPKQMLPFLKGLSDDERIPLIARNHAARLIAQAQKEKK